MKPHSLVTAILVIFGGVPATAQDLYSATWEDMNGRLTSLQEENQALSDRLASLESEISGTPSYLPTSSKHAESICARCISPKWTAGASLYYIKPYWETNPAYALVIDNPPEGETFDTYEQVDLDWDHLPAWDVWLKIVSDSGLGGRARYFRFDQQSKYTVVPSQSSDDRLILPSPLGLPATANWAHFPVRFSTGLDLQVVDFEATQVFNGDGWQWEAAGGLRWSRVEQDYLAIRETSVPTIEFPRLVRHHFDGLGPTLALEGRRGLGHRGCMVYGKVRAAVLAGKTEEVAIDYQSSAGELENDGKAARWDLLPVGELELGLRHAQCYGTVGTFCEFGLVGHVWFGAGNASNSSALSPGEYYSPSPPAQFNGSNNDNMALFGFRSAAGITY